MGHRRARAIHTTMIFHTCPQHKCLKKSHLLLADSLPLYMFKASHTFLSRFQPIHSKFLLTQVVGIFVLSLLFSKKNRALFLCIREIRWWLSGRKTVESSWFIKLPHSEAKQLPRVELHFLSSGKFPRERWFEMQETKMFEICSWPKVESSKKTRFLVKIPKICQSVGCFAEDS